MGGWRGKTGTEAELAGARLGLQRARRAGGAALAASALLLLPLSPVKRFLSGPGAGFGSPASLPVRGAGFALWCLLGGAFGVLQAGSGTEPTPVMTGLAWEASVPHPHTHWCSDCFYPAKIQSFCLAEQGKAHTHTRGFFSPLSVLYLFPPWLCPCLSTQG